MKKKFFTICAIVFLGFTGCTHRESANIDLTSLMLCVPVWNRDKISYLAVPLGYRIWQKKESKLELAASMVRHVMPEFSSQKNVIILCDSWYTKQNLVSIVKEYPNLDLIENARADSIIYDHL